ncbi:MAG: hypothetical protein IJ379_05190 [Lachnospiraceae bacterium]|nr:hypothetical protein [Lachnospiraceae bacterium]
MVYADSNYYTSEYKGTVLSGDEVEKGLRTASMHIDSLTYNRIVGRGIDNLTPFQQDIIRRVCCMQADFESENAELIESVLKSYAINGVSMSFGDSWNVKVESGVAIRRDVYSLLCQTGLCTRRLM